MEMKVLFFFSKKSKEADDVIDPRSPVTKLSRIKGDFFEYADAWLLNPPIWTVQKKTRPRNLLISRFESCNILFKCWQIAYQDERNKITHFCAQSRYIHRNSPRIVSPFDKYTWGLHAICYCGCCIMYLYVCTPIAITVSCRLLVIAIVVPEIAFPLLLALAWWSEVMPSALSVTTKYYQETILNEKAECFIEWSAKGRQKCLNSQKMNKKWNDE